MDRTKITFLALLDLFAAFNTVDHGLLLYRPKVTVQFETEGNGQNEIFSHMHRSEIKL